jgi:hypothetical protein
MLVGISSYDRSFRRAQVHEHLRVTPAFARVIFGNKKKAIKFLKLGELLCVFLMRKKMLRGEKRFH